MLHGAPRSQRIWQDFRISPRAFIRGGSRAVLLLKSSLSSRTMAHPEVLDVCKTLVNPYFTVTPWPSGHFFTNLIQKCLWAPPLTDATHRNVDLNNVTVAGSRWFLFSLYLVVFFFRFPAKNMPHNHKIKKRRQHGALKIWW